MDTEREQARGNVKMEMGTSKEENEPEPLEFINYLLTMYYQKFILSDASEFKKKISVNCSVHLMNFISQSITFPQESKYVSPNPLVFNLHLFSLK